MIRFSFVPLCACLFAVACAQGNSTNSSKSPSTSAPASTTEIAARGTDDVAPSTPLAKGLGNAEVEIGAREVDGTPVAKLAPHKDHLPIVETPPRPFVPVPEDAAGSGREWFVAVSGHDTDVGSSAAPFKTIQKGIDAAGPGDVVHVGAGQYAETLSIGASAKAGLVAGRILLRGEGSPKIVPPSSHAYTVIEVSRPYWIIDGFEIDVRGMAKFAVAFVGTTEGSTLANSRLHHGAGGAGVTTHGNSTGVLIDNNEIFNFTRGSVDSHGVVVQPTSKRVTIRNNDIHDVSGDSVQCLGPEGFSSLPPADGVLIEQNHFYRNRENAVDIKTCANVTVRLNRMHNFRASTTVGGNILVVHMSAKNVTIEDNEIYDGGKGIAIGGNHVGPVPTNIIVRRNRIHNLVKTGTLEGSGIRVENSMGVVIANNTLTNLQGPAFVMGHGTGGATTNLRMLNNLVDAPAALNLGTMAPGLKSQNNLFALGARFEMQSGVRTFSSWQGAVGDRGSFEADSLTEKERLSPGLPAVNAGVADPSVVHCGSAPDIGAYETDCG